MESPGDAELPTLFALAWEGQWALLPEGKLLVMGVCEGNFCFLNLLPVYFKLCAHRWS